jgi:hypothetical protein
VSKWVLFGTISPVFTAVPTRWLDALLAAATATDPQLPLLVRLARARDLVAATTPPPAAAGGADDRRAASLDSSEEETSTAADIGAALLAWAPGWADLGVFTAMVRAARTRLQELRRDDAPLTLSTAHATKGLEFDDVAVLMDAGRFPSARSLADAADPARALEEERRLAYVAWTRARCSLTLLFDPAAPSRFLLEVFSATELGAADEATAAGAG